MSRPDDATVHAAALAGLPGMTPVRLAKLLDGFHPALAWKAVRAGAHPADPRRRFAVPARATDVSEVGVRYARQGVKVLLPHMVSYPSMLVGDPGAPAVLFALGDPTVVEGKPRVAIVGTRTPTPYGRQVASDLARELADEGVTVISGLARGIDGAAHAGVLRADHDEAAPPVAVVGTGLDVVYPSSNRELWDQVATKGSVFSESALGTKPHPGVFPARNRIIAALSDVVVVVESHHGGGSLYTAEAAARRSIPVCAVPGSVRSPASDGTNALLVDGCAPIRDATDVLVAISLARTGKDESIAEIRAVQADRIGGTAAGDRPDVRQDPDRPDGTAAADRPDRKQPKRLRLDTRRPIASPLPVNEPSALPSHGNGSIKVRRASIVIRSRTIPGRDSPLLSEQQRVVWEAVDDTPTTFETILIRTDLSIAQAAEVCDVLVENGVLLAGSGWWSRRPR